MGTPIYATYRIPSDRPHEHRAWEIEQQSLARKKSELDLGSRLPIAAKPVQDIKPYEPGRFQKHL